MGRKHKNETVSPVVSPTDQLPLVQTNKKRLRNQTKCHKTQHGPTVADDMVLISYSRNGLQKMIDICNCYAKRWRFLYNAKKCATLLFNVKHGPNKQHQFNIGDEQIPAIIQLRIQCIRPHQTVRTLFWMITVSLK